MFKNIIQICIRTIILSDTTMKQSSDFMLWVKKKKKEENTFSCSSSAVMLWLLNLQLFLLGEKLHQSGCRPELFLLTCYEQNWGERWSMLYKKPNSGTLAKWPSRELKRTQCWQAWGKMDLTESLICGSAAQNGRCLGGKVTPKQLGPPASAFKEPSLQPSVSTVSWSF